MGVRRPLDVTMISLLRLVSRPLAGIGVFIGQVLRSAHRQDLPSHNNQDPSGWFGSQSAPPLRLVLLGDSSITAPGVVPTDDSWAHRLAHHLSARYFVDLRSVAVGGAKMRDVLEYQLPQALALGGDLALVSAGANDALRATPVARLEQELSTIVKTLQKEFPKVGVAGVGDLGTLPRLPDLARSMSRLRARSIDDAIRRVARSHQGVVKARAWGGDWQRFTDHAEVTFAQDQFHASGAGHAIFAASIIPAVEALLAAPRGVNEWRGNSGSVM